MRKKSVVRTVGRVSGVVATLLALGNPRVKAQAEIDPDHFEGPNTEPFPQPKPTDFPFQVAADCETGVRPVSENRASQIPLKLGRDWHQDAASLKAAIGHDTAAASAKEVEATERGVRIPCDLAVLGFMTKTDRRKALTADSTLFLDKKSPVFGSRVRVPGIVSEHHQGKQPWHARRVPVVIWYRCDDEFSGPRSTPAARSSVRP